MTRVSKGFIALVIISFLCFVFAILFLPDVWADLTATIFDLLAAGFIVYTVLASSNKKFRVNFLFIGAAVFFWGLADLLWFIIDEILLLNPVGNIVITACYLGTRISLIASLLYYAFGRLRKWDTVQLVLDGITFSIALVWLLWAILYHKTASQLQALVSHSIANTAAIGLDIFLTIIISMWYLSLRKGETPKFLQILLVSVFLFPLVDLAYYQLNIKGEYIPDSLLDVFYLPTLLGMVLSVHLYYRNYPASYADLSPDTNIGRNHKGLLIVLCPLMIFLFHPIDIVDIIVYAVLIAFHEAGTAYIQASIRQKELLHQEIDDKKKLERLVAERTQDLRAAIDTLRQRNEELQYINVHDRLTGLYNRNHFLQALDVSLQDIAQDEKLGLIVWNIDNLKGVNDTYGYQTGDRVLVLHAKRMEALLAPQGMLARFGNDEFVFLRKGIFTEQDVLYTADQIVHTCKQPLQIGDYSLAITCSVGLSLYPECAFDPQSLLKNADIAMLYAKETRPDSHIAMYKDIDQAVERKTLLGNRLKAADFNRDLHLHFQPQFRIQDQALIGVEALLRWNPAGIGPVSPAEFIPIAESENQIIPIGNWVIENAVKQIARWNRDYHSTLRMGINISPKQFSQAQTFSVLDAAIRNYQAKTAWIDIEITEGVALDNENASDDIQKHFRSKGITVSIDDFGTGYSSLGYLSMLSFDRLKIAKPLIDQVTFNESRRKIVTSIILLAKSLGLETISEGVENQAQFELLKTLGCDQIQGYYLGKPEPAEDFAEHYLKPLAGKTTP